MNGELEVIEDDILTLTLIDTGSHADILQQKKTAGKGGATKGF